MANRSRPITKEDCLRAMRNTQSVKAAAHYLGHSYHHVKRYFKLYTDKETGKSLFDLHKNQSAKGIRRGLKNKKSDRIVEDIITGKQLTHSYTPTKIKNALIQEGYLAECCSRCGFSERRVLDYKVPLIMHFADSNRKNYRIENLALYCYNCYFLYIAEVFTEADIRSLEDYVVAYKTTDIKDFEIDEYHMQRLRELGLDPTHKDDEFDLISRM